MSYGIVVSKAGHDTDADPEHLVLSSELNALKVKATGTLTGTATVAHGLSYVPIFFAMHKQVGSYTRYSACWGSMVDNGVDSTNFRVGNSGAPLRYYLLYQQAI